MAMNSTTLAAALKGLLLANDDAGAVDNDALTALCDEIAEAVVTHITTNAVLVVTAGIPVTTAGTAAAQTGVTTAPGTGTIT